MATFNEIKDEVTRLELAKRLYGAGIEMYDGSIGGKTLEDYPQELADNIFEDIEINWIGNGNLEYEDGSTYLARKSRVACVDTSTGKFPINMNETYYDIPIPISAGCRIETEIYFPLFYREYFGVIQGSAWGGDNNVSLFINDGSTNDSSVRTGFKYYNKWNSSTETTHLLDLNGNYVNWTDSTITATDWSTRPYLSLITPLSFEYPMAQSTEEYAYANINFSLGYNASWSPASPTTKSNGLNSAGLGFREGFETSNDYIDGDTRSTISTGSTGMIFPDAWSRSANGNAGTWGQSTAGNRYYPLSVTFNTNNYLDLFVDHGGYCARYQGNYDTTHAPMRHAYKNYPTGGIVYGTYPMRIFGSLSRNQGCYKGWRFKEFKVYTKQNVLVMHLVPRVHFVAKLLRFEACWYDIVSDTYHYPIGSSKDLTYGF